MLLCCCPEQQIFGVQRSVPRAQPPTRCNVPLMCFSEAESLRALHSLLASSFKAFDMRHATKVCFCAVFGLLWVLLSSSCGVAEIRLSDLKLINVVPGEENDRGFEIKPQRGSKKGQFFVLCILLNRCRISSDQSRSSSSDQSRLVLLFCMHVGTGARQP